jgi:hypothetical protein
MSDFLSSLSSLLQIVLVFLILIIGFILARLWRIRKLRGLVRGQLPFREELKQAVSKLFSSEVLEVAAVGAVTYVDMAWQYSLADPQIWSHLDGAGAANAAHAMADPHLLETGLGEHAQSALGHVAEHFQHAEALQTFDHSLDSVMRLGADLPDAVLLLDGHPHSLLDLLLHKGHAADALAPAKAQALSDGAAGTLLDAKTGTLVDAKASALTDAKTSALLDAKVSALADAKTSALLDAKASGILDAPWDGGDLWHHIPLITIGFATYRAWRRAEGGAQWGRNLEFAATEVVSRSGGALAGAKVGGTVGTLVVPGYGTVIGSVVGAVGGAIAGARLSEEIKRRHVRQAQRGLDKALHNLGTPYLEDPVGYRRLQAVFSEQERNAKRGVEGTRREYTAYARWWRRLWPDQKLVLLQETAREADERLRDIHQQVRDTLERVEVLRQQNNYKALGLILWNAPGMCRQLNCAEVLIREVDRANERLRHELQQVGVAPA